MRKTHNQSARIGSYGSYIRKKNVEGNPKRILILASAFAATLMLEQFQKIIKNYQLWDQNFWWRRSFRCFWNKLRCEYADVAK